MNSIRFPNDDVARRFYNTVRDRVDQWRQDHPRYRDGLVTLWARACFWCLTSAALYIAALTNGPPQWWHLILASAFATTSLAVGFSIGHDASHGVVTRCPWLDNLIQILSFVGIGIDPTLWRLRHTHSHHIYPNVSGGDIDVAENPLLRLSPHQRWRRHFRWQHWYAPLVYLIVTPHSVFIGDFIHLARELRQRQGWEWWRMAIAFSVSKLLHFGVLAAIPMSLLHLSAGQMILGYAVMTTTTSMWFSLMLVGTHFCDKTQHPKPDELGRLPHGWAVHSLVTSCDWNPGSWLASVVSGGANTHAAHHLFPALPNVWYREITPIIAATADEFGLPFNACGLWAMWRSHFRFLRSLSRPHPTIHRQASVDDEAGGVGTEENDGVSHVGGLTESA